MRCNIARICAFPDCKPGRWSAPAQERPSLVKARPTATHDFYGPVHKGLRFAQSQMLVRLGACDGRDTEVLTQLIDDLMSLLHLAEHHMENEERCAHTALEARAPGASARLAQGHQRFRRTAEDIEALIGQVEARSS